MIFIFKDCERFHPLRVDAIQSAELLGVKQWLQRFRIVWCTVFSPYRVDWRKTTRRALRFPGEAAGIDWEATLTQNGILCEELAPANPPSEEEEEAGEEEADLELEHDKP